ncbi:hypothetical protein J1N35_030514 [Gossypium stocksii]|uniref:Uncharacterized protein n=1 Tax=Gossypium stocksii TaxID=47602 RepID=A0A9D3ZU77_9ROSI|nr:hypothetical protein J1N35_030514 [Gossypium stocksii]
MPLTLQHLLVQNIGILSNHDPMLGGLNINYEVHLGPQIHQWVLDDATQNAGVARESRHTPFTQRDWHRAPNAEWPV